MADNYLEKKMEEHRAGGGCSSSSYHPRLTPRGNRPGELTLNFTPCDLFIKDIQLPIMTSAARELASVGFKVCFTDDDIHRGTKLAVTLGCRYLPPLFPLPEDLIKLNMTDGAIVMSRGQTALKLSLSSDFDTAAPLPVEIEKTVIWMAFILANFNDFHENVLKNIKIEGFSL